MIDDKPPAISKWWVFAALMTLAIVLNVSLYVKVSLYGP